MNYGAIAWALAPEAILALTALAVLGMDAALARRWSVPVRWRARWQQGWGVAGCLGALVWLAAADPPGRLAGMLVLDATHRGSCARRWQSDHSRAEPSCDQAASRSI